MEDNKNDKQFQNFVSENFPAENASQKSKSENQSRAATQIQEASLKKSSEEIDRNLAEKKTVVDLKVEDKKQSASQSQPKKSLVDIILGPLRKKYAQKHQAQSSSSKTSNPSNQSKGEDLSKYDERPLKLSDQEKAELKEAEKIYQQGITALRDLIAPSSMKVDVNDLNVSGLYSRSFYVFSYPRFIDTNWLSPIINFDASMDISQFIYPTDSGRILKVLRTKVAQMQSSMRINAEKGLVSDPKLETQLADAERLRRDIQR